MIPDIGGAIFCLYGLFVFGLLLVELIRYNGW